MAMTSGHDYAAQRGIDMTQDRISMEDFDHAGLPMVVACRSCDMTMTLISPSVLIDDDGSVFCKGCAEIANSQKGETTNDDDK